MGYYIFTARWGLGGYILFAGGPWMPAFVSSEGSIRIDSGIMTCKSRLKVYGLQLSKISQYRISEV